MLIFAGLGNPGARYARNRHNIGFMAVDEIARLHRASPWRARFQAEACEATIGAEKVILLKPQTYMNESGRAIGEAARFFKIAPADIVVFHDELDLAPFKVKVRRGGGLAGHNGLRSINQHLGPDFRRVRIGIGHPGTKDRVTGHVLGNYAKGEMDGLADMLGAIGAEAEWLARDDDVRFMNDIALRMQD